MADAQVIEFPFGRQSKNTVPKLKDQSLSGSISRHPTNTTRKVDESKFIAIEHILPKGMNPENAENIEYRCQRLDVALTHFTKNFDPEEMELLAHHVRVAVKTIAELTYQEGLAEGYMAAEENDY